MALWRRFLKGFSEGVLQGFLEGGKEPHSVLGRGSQKGAFRGCLESKRKTRVVGERERESGSGVRGMLCPGNFCAIPFPALSLMPVLLEGLWRAHLHSEKLRSWDLRASYQPSAIVELSHWQTSIELPPLHIHIYIYVYTYNQERWTSFRIYASKTSCL